MKAEHFNETPSAVVAAMLAAFAPYGPAGSKLIRTVARIEDDTVEAIDRAVAGALPAVLVFYAGGKYSPAATHGQRFKHVMLYRLAVLSGTFQGRAERLSGGERDIAAATQPGVEDLLDWAMYICCRAANAIGCKEVRPAKDIPSETIQPNRYLAVVDIEATRLVDICDDSGSTALLTRLGLVGNPEDANDLWTDAGHTAPNIAAPDTRQGGVADL